MLISIITINYNNAVGLRKTIESVISQSNTFFEYIIIDGGSTDGSKEIIETYKNHVSYWVSEKDAGIYQAMNKGWRQATGEYCLFLNSGDYLYNENVIEQSSDLINKNSADIIYGNLFAFDETQSWISTFTNKISLYYFSNNFIPHPSTFTKRSLLIQLNGFHEHYSILSDWTFFIEAFIAKAIFSRIDLTISAFYMKGISSGSKKGLYEREQIFENELKFLREDFRNFKRLRHFDTSILTRIARKLSSIKIKYFK